MHPSHVVIIQIRYLSFPSLSSIHIIRNHKSIIAIFVVYFIIKRVIYYVNNINIYTYIYIYLRDYENVIFFFNFYQVFFIFQNGRVFYLFIYFFSFNTFVSSLSQPLPSSYAVGKIMSYTVRKELDYYTLSWFYAIRDTDTNFGRGILRADLIRVNKKAIPELVSGD